jgi:hypothetical protein
MTCGTFRRLDRLGELLPAAAVRWQRSRLDAHAAVCAPCRADRARRAALPGLLRQAYQQQVAFYPAPAHPISGRTTPRPGLAPRRWLPLGIAAAATVAALILWAGWRVSPPLHSTGGSVVQQAKQGSALRKGGPAPPERRPRDPRLPVLPAIASPGRGGRAPAATIPPGARVARGLHERPAAAPVADDRYLDGRGAMFQEHWLVDDRQRRALRRWLDALPRPVDDFIEVPKPLLAALEPDGRLLAAARRRYEEEASKVDPRLFRKVTLALKAASLDELCAALEKQLSVSLRAARGVGDENVTVFVKDRPAREVLRAVARLFGYRWNRSGDEGQWRYEFYQDLKSQLAEEELRNRDLNAALVALDEQMALYRPALDLDPEQLKARAEPAPAAEKERLEKLLGGGWGAVQVYHRLSPAQRAALARGEPLEFSTRAESLDRLLPAAWRPRLLASSGLALGDFGGKPFIEHPAMLGNPVPLTQIAAAGATVTLSLNRSELGRLTLTGGTGGFVADSPAVPLGGRGPVLATGASPSVAQPENAAANRELRREAAFRRTVSLRPEPSCPWFAGRGLARPADMTGFHVEMNGRPFYMNSEGRLTPGEEPPHVTTADVWEAVHRETGLPVVADAYSRVYDAARLTVERAPCFDALCRVGDDMGVRWKKDGDFLLARSTSYFWDKLKEVPKRDLQRWQADRRASGFLPLDDVLELGTLTDQQLDSRLVGHFVSHCWGLEEWGMVGDGGAWRVALPSGGYLRPYVRFLVTLTPAQRQRALLPEGIAFGDLASPQQEALARQPLYGGPPRQLLPAVRLHLDYAPVGAYVWFPSVESYEASEAANRDWPMVHGKSPEATLAMARRFQPRADPQQIWRSRGILNLTFLAPDGTRWKLGAPGAAIHHPPGE